MPFLVEEKPTTYSQWANHNGQLVFVLSSVLILIFVPIFHWIMPSIDNSVYDSLNIRLIASIPAALCLVLYVFKKFRKHLLSLQVIQLAAMLWGMFWVSGLSGFTPFYLTASLLGIVATSLTLMTRRQVLWTTLAGIVSFFSFYAFNSERPTPFVLMFYASAGVITISLAVVKVLFHEREFLLRQALSRTMSDLQKERTQKFMQNEQAFLGELSSSVAHEINNPLCTLRFSLERIGENLNDNSTTIQGLFQRALKQEQRIKTFIDHLLFFSGVHFVENKSLTISKIIQLTSHLLRPLLIKNQTLLLVNISSVETILKSQAQDVAQILYQLVKIAIEVLAKNNIATPSVKLKIFPLQDLNYNFAVEFEDSQRRDEDPKSFIHNLSETQSFRFESIQHLVKRNFGRLEIIKDNGTVSFQVILS